MSLLDLSHADSRLWKAFQSARGALDPTRHPVVSRWRRAMGLGVRSEGDPDSRELVRGGALDASRDRSGQLIDSATTALAPRLRGFARADFSLLLTDADGLILEAHAGGAFETTARALHLLPGGRWTEAAQGTNAIGTALTERRPVTVFGSAHYVRANHGLVCYASPIFDPYGALIGVLDATSDARAASDAIRRAVDHGARAIQTGLQDQAWRSAGERLVGPVLTRCPEPAVLIEWPGTIRRANRAASQIAGRAVEGLDINAVCGIEWPTLLDRLAEGGDLIVAPRWGDDARSRRLMIHPVEGANGRCLGVLLLAEPSTRRPHGASTTPDAFAPIIGSDPILVETRRLAARVARSRLPVLLLAETGTGKGLLAQAIHEASDRAAGPLVDINCGAISPSLLESELFGYAPGAFTGALRAGREGKIQAATGGTLFLDEVGEMSPRLQALLLKVLEGGRYTRVGEASPRQADFRLMCATCRDLEAMVAAGDFRSDLYYRIRGAVLRLPTLRARTDLAELAIGLLHRLAETAGRTTPRLSDAALTALAGHDWPGNVRELRMTLEYALTLSDGPVIEVTDLPPEFHQRPAQLDAPPTTLLGAKKQALLRVLRETTGNISEAARRMGVARSTIYRMMRRHDIDPNRWAG